MKLGVLFSGGKDSTYAAYLAKKQGYELECLITLFSENQESYMFHTPAIELTEKQAKLMNIPIIIQETKGEKEQELEDLERAIKKAIKKYHIEGIVTGAIESVYQASRIQKICNQFKIECFNPFWQKNQLEHLKDLIKEGFEVIISGVFAYPFDKKWIGRRIDSKCIEDLSILKEKYKINPAGEGGEFESLIMDCPLYNENLNVRLKEINGSGNSWIGKFE